jgi:hypothetical protein
VGRASTNAVRRPRPGHANWSCREKVFAIIVATSSKRSQDHR